MGTVTRAVAKITKLNDNNNDPSININININNIIINGKQCCLGNCSKDNEK